jgi:DNA-binding LacI/PurR family transcriptional regulator
MLKTARQPKHRRVCELILEQMAAERLKVGDSLPTESMLAESLGVGRNTMRQAMAELSREGFIKRIQGRAAFVTKEVPRSRSTTTGVFGLILPDVRGALYPSLIKGFGEISGASHRSMIICETGNDLGRQADAILQMIDRRVAGVAMVPTTSGSPPHHFRQLQEHDIPVVLCHRGFDGAEVSVVAWCWEEVARLAASAITACGHRRVAFAAYLRYRHTQVYEDTFRQALRKQGVDLPARWVCYNEQFVNPAGEDEVRRALVAMLSSSDRPTAVFANDLAVGERVYLEALHLGLRVPEDVSIVAFGGKWREGPIYEQLAAVTVDEVELGREAARMLSGFPVGHSAWGQRREYLLPLEFVAGRSLAPPAGQKMKSVNEPVHETAID